MPFTASQRFRGLSVLLSVLLAVVLLGLTTPVANAAGTGTITGVVKSSSGAFVNGAWVGLWTPNEDGYEADTETNASGAYTFTNVPAGEYLVHVYATGGDAGTYHPSAGTAESAEVVTVTAGGTVTANVQMVKPASISGTVTKPGGTPAAGVDVEAYLRTGSCATCWQSVTDAVRTGTNGVYVASGLFPGTYRIGFSHDDFQNEFFNNSATLAGATDIIVVPGQKKTGINAQLDNGAVVTGIVRDQANRPVEGIRVSAYREEGQIWRAAMTGADGTYRLEGLASGTYQVAARDFEDFHLSVTRHLEVTAPQTTANLNFVVEQTGTISGHVYDHTGAGIGEGELRVYQKQPPGSSPEWEEFDGFWWFDTGGVFGLRVPVGTYRFSVGNWSEGSAGDAITYYGGTGTLSTASDVVVSTPGQKLTSKNVKLLHGATVSGTVSGPSGVAPFVPIGVVDATTGEKVSGYEYTAQNGTYSVNGLPPGSYKIEFGRGAGPGPLVGEFYDDVSEAAGAAAATTLTLTAGQTRTGVNATLAAGGGISGTLERSDGSPIADCLVEAFSADEKRSPRVGLTGEDGSFTIAGLGAGDYALRVNPLTFGEPQNHWACAGLPNPNGDDGFSEGDREPDPAYYSAADGTLTWADDELRMVTVAASETTALPVTLRLGTPAEIANTAIPTVSGNPAVGATLSATPGSWDTDGVKISYQWKSAGGDVGTDQPTYVPTADDAGNQITVVVTATKTGFQDASATSLATPAVNMTISNSVLPRIGGTLRVGSTLTAARGTWSPSGLTFTYQWVRASTPIGGANKSTYKPTASDAGKTLKVVVRAARFGATSLVKSSAATSAVAKGILVLSGTPSVSGIPRVGRTLTAKAPTCTPSAVITFQWLRNGNAISGATRSTYTAIRADKGTQLTVRMTFKRTGYVTVQRTVSAAGKVT